MHQPNRAEQRAVKHALARAGYFTSANGVSHESLTVPAYENLASFLIKTGNVLSEEHRAALMALCGLLTETSQGKRPGRWAFGLPTGMGKSSGIVAWCAALTKLGNKHVSVAVSASKIEALCDLKRDMIRAGVPEDSIGLIYTHSGTKYAFPPTDGNDQRQVMLVAHNRIRMKDGHDQFMTFKGKPRDLLIWDESLVASEAKGFDLDAFDKAIGLVKGAWRRFTDDKHTAASEWLDACQACMDGTIKAATQSRPEMLQLPTLSDASLLGIREMLPEDDAAKPVADLLDFYREELRAMPTSQGGGVVWYETAVPSEIKNIIVLDASYHIRMLCRADKTIRNAETNIPEIRNIGKPLADLKRHDNVTIHQLFSGGGRSTMAKDFGDRTKQLAVKEVVDVVKGIPETEAVLVFVFKDRNTKQTSYAGAMYRALADAGIDTHAKLDTGLKDEDGQPVMRDRINVATWGQETSLNRWAHCSNVILCGVLQRSSLDLAGSYLGQTDDIRHDVSTDTIKELARSEVAHVVYQALSRGCCRVMDDGQAKAMKAWVVHRDLGIRGLLEDAMPGIRWETWEAKHLTTTDGRQPGIIASTAVKIREHLKGLPREASGLSTRKLKEATGSKDVHPNTFTEALKAALQSCLGWNMAGRSVVRSA